ncbi:hypothetical protein MAR_026099 [Mya arenaria]|uniref:Uncharacterized protein n=1 Tax=Mya arenaria TaxID=6604 RepID=A0ABY7ESK8_MYAAR|nr:hypothetical protein MAR_026099 [Mya arenaria]
MIGKVQTQKPKQTVKGKVNAEPPNKRSYSEVSNESVGDISAINIHLDEITSDISKLRADVMKKDDIE